MSTKKLLSNSIIYIALGFLTPAVNFILLPIYTRYLESEDYALITQSMMIQGIFATILGFGVNVAFTRFFYDSYKDSEKLNNLYSTTILSCLFTGGLVIAGFSLIGDWVIGKSFRNDVFTYWDYGIYSVIVALLMNIQTVSLSYYRNLEKASSYAKLSIFSFLCVASSIYVGVVVLELEAKGSIVGRFIGTLVPLLIYLIWYFSKHPIKYASILNKKMLIYGLPLVPYLLLNVVLGQADKFAVERYFDLAILGLYGFGFLIATVNDIFINSINAALAPQVYRNMGTEDESQLEKVRKLIKAYISLGLIINIGITVCGTIGIHYFLEGEYQTVAAFFPLLSISYIPRVFFTAYQMPVMYNKQTKVMPFINAVTLIVYIIGFLLLAPRMGIYGVCVAAILIKLCQMVSIFVFIKHKGIDKTQVPILDLKYEYLVSSIIFLYVGFWYVLSKEVGLEYKYLLYIPLLILVFVLTQHILKLLGLNVRQLLRTKSLKS